MEETPVILKSGRVWRSKFIVSLLSFLATIVICTWLMPKNYRPAEAMPSLITAKPYILRTEKFLYSDRNPEIILMGSSLVVKPSFECDRAMENLKVPANQEAVRQIKQSYAQSQHLKRLLQARLTGSFDLVNIGVPACMVGDYYLALEKLIDFGKRPQLIILGLAPREFVDNGYPDPRQTASAQLMTACSPMRKWWRHPLAALDFMQHFLNPGAFLESLSDTLKVQAFSYRYMIQGQCDMPFHELVDQYQRYLTSIAPKSTPAATVKKTPLTKKYFDLDAYRWCYDSPDMAHFGRQIGYLDKFVALARRRHIAVVLVNMPLTVENQALLDANVLDVYNKVLSAVAARYNVMLVDAEKQSGCKDGDFVDSVHLNAAGGHKCFDFMAKAIASNSSLKEKLCAVQSEPDL